MSLSDKIEHNARLGSYHDWLRIEDVKQSIQKILDMFENRMSYKEIYKELKEEMGEKLI